MTSDLALLGRLGDHVVAASALAHTVLFAAFVIGMGLVSAVSPLAAQAFGARQPRMVRRALRVGLWAATLLGMPLERRRSSTANSSCSRSARRRTRRRWRPTYLKGLAWCMVPAWWFIALRGFMQSVNRPEPGLWITLAAIPANGVLAYALIYGEFGLPRLEMFGAGLATTIVNLGMCVAGVWVCYACRPFKKYRVLGRFWRARLGAVRPPVRDRRADLGHHAARIRRVRRGGAADGLARHRGARGPPDRASPPPRSCSWCRSASRWRRPCGSAMRSAGATPRPRGAPGWRRSRSARASWRR